MTIFRTFTEAEREALKLHGLDTHRPSQLSDAFVLGLRHAAFCWPDGLLDRIKAAEQRVQDNRAPRSIPADPHSDVDLVLAEVRYLIEGSWPPFWLKDASSAAPGVTVAHAQTFPSPATHGGDR